MSEIGDAHRAAQRANEAPGRRVDLMVACGIAVVTVAGLLVYPYAKADEARHATRYDDRLTTQAAAVVVPTVSTVRESPVSAPPLVEALPIAARPVVPKAGPADGSQRNAANAARTAHAPAIPVIASMPALEAGVIGDGQSVEPLAPPTAAPTAVIDPWQMLRDTLAACGRSSGVWERATCEQRARLAHCYGHWGNVALCPSGRTEFGQ